MTYAEAMVYVKANKWITLEYDSQNYGYWPRRWQAMYFKQGLRLIVTTAPTLESAVAKLKRELEKNENC